MRRAFAKPSSVTRSPTAGVAAAMLLCAAGACSSDEASKVSMDASTDAGPRAPARPACAGESEDPAACLACVHQGLVQGLKTDASCEYLGIPYARPPVGERRFTAPEPAEAWKGVRDARAFGSACAQQATGIDLSGGAMRSEDCLFINVWTPASAADAALPVMVFIHGGGYTGGSTNTYPGLGLSAAGPVVVVSMNYRLGALGFFAHPDLDAQRAGEPSGSDAIRDQQLALHWVHDNIAAFHGDPGNVTLFGESAGSSAVGVHLVSPGSRGLAARFIMESGVSTHGVAGGIEPVSREQMYAFTQRMASDLCPGSDDVIACLRELPADQLTRWAPSGAGGGAAPELPWVPVVEGKGGVLPDTPEALMRDGEVNPGEIIVGTNKNEYGLFQLLPGAGAVSTLAQLRASVEAQWGDRADEIMALYAPDDSVDARAANVTLMTDVMFRCQTRHFARLSAALGRSVYLYSFEQGTAYHSEELIYVFGKGYFTLAINTSPVAALVEAIQGYWLEFARSGDPNSGGRLQWPRYDMQSDQHLTLVDPPAIGSALQKDACDFWDGYLEAQ